jgi:ribosomal protein S18 acetylase RimI-like enzyme
MPLTVVSDAHASDADKDIVRNGIDEGNMRITGRRDTHPIAIFVRDEQGAIRGGILGDVWAGWLHITYLWIADGWRGQGYGSQLLRAAESEARALGCQSATVESFSFQAPGFYQKYGYEVFATLPERPPGHTYYYLRKQL